jgi:hypothetical protein
MLYSIGMGLGHRDGLCFASGPIALAHDTAGLDRKLAALAAKKSRLDQKQFASC